MFRNSLHDFMQYEVVQLWFHALDDVLSRSSFAPVRYSLITGVRSGLNRSPTWAQPELDFPACSGLRGPCAADRSITL
jgi:hypothetical protein